MAQKEKKKKVSGGGIAAALVVALLALGGGYGYKNGMLDGFIGKEDKKTETTTKAGDEKNEVIQIVIKDDVITVGGKTVEAEKLEAAIKEKGESASFSVKDDRAIKDTYDKVISTLDELGVKYSIIQN